MSSVNTAISMLLGETAGSLIAYHATIAGTKIQADGFKTRDQLGGKAALGGGSDSSISFTTDWNVAKGVFDGFIFMWSIANSPNMVEYVRNHYSTLKPEVQATVAKYFDGGPGRLQMLFRGTRPGGMMSYGGSEDKTPKTAEELAQLGFGLPVDDKGETAPRLGGKYYGWEEPMSEKDLEYGVYSYVKSYLAADPDVYDPLFFGASVASFRNIPRGDIGILTCELNIDPARQAYDDFPSGERISYRMVGSMAELRMYDLKDIKSILDYETEPGKTAKYSSRVLHYAEDPEVEQSVNIILKALQKHYQLIQTHTTLSPDYLISLFQSKKDVYSIVSLLKQFLEATELYNYTYDLYKINMIRAKLVIDSNIQTALDAMPENIKNSILSGEQSVDDAEEAWYDADPDGQSDWYDKFYDTRRGMDRYWQQDYVRYSKMYYEELERIKANSPKLIDRWGDENLLQVADLVNSIRLAKGVFEGVRA